MKKLIIAVMGQDAKDHLSMCLPSVQGADHLVYVDGGSTDDSIEYAKSMSCDVIENEFSQTDPEMNGKQRNFYLRYLKKNYMHDWVLCLDADEVLSEGGVKKLKNFIQKTNGDRVLYSVKMRHLIQDLSHEDSMQEEHYCFNRLFQIQDGLEYPLGEHHPLIFNDGDTKTFRTDIVTVWHLAFSPLFHVRSRYIKNIKHSAVHSKSFLDQWYKSHLFGSYPKKAFNPIELPKFILDFYKVDKDELYFSNRNLETKHFIDALHWKEFFKCKTAIELGCGRGPRVFALNSMGVRTLGIEKSKWAVKNSLMNKAIMYGDIMTKVESDKKFDLVLAYDLLEHIKYDKLDFVIGNLKYLCKKHILISVPVLGDPNLEADPTHIIKECKEWWIERFVKNGCKLVPTPSYFLFSPQVMIFEVNK